MSEFEPINTIDQTMSPEQSSPGSEVAQYAVTQVKLAANGVAHVLSEHLLRHTEGITDGFDNSRHTLAEMPDVYGNPEPFVLPPPKPGENPRTRQVKSLKEGSLVYRAINPNFTPITKIQEAQMARAGRRQAKADRLGYSDQYRLRGIFGEDIGTREYTERIQAARMKPSERRRALRANEKFLQIQRKRERLSGRVQKSAEGRDIPGEVAQAKLDAVLSVRSRLLGLQRRTSRRRLELGQSLDQISADIAAGKERRRLSKLPPPPDVAPDTSPDSGYDD